MPLNHIIKSKHFHNKIKTRIYYDLMQSLVRINQSTHLW